MPASLSIVPLWLVRAAGFAAAAFARPFARRARSIGCMRCWGRCISAGSRLQETMHITPDIGKFMQCVIQSELLVFHQACNAVPELAIRVEELFCDDVA